MRGKFTREGRDILFNGHPFIRIEREGSTVPFRADDATRLIVKMFNRSTKAKRIASGNWSTDDEV